MSTQPAAIEITDLAKEYPPKQVLRGVNVRVPYGTTLCLLGPNGAGKTTTVEILQGLRRASGGTVRVLGEDPAPRTNAWRARIGVVSQASGDLGELTVREAVELASRFFADPMPVDEAVARVGLCDDARSRAGARAHSAGRPRRLGTDHLVVLHMGERRPDARPGKVFLSHVQPLSKRPGNSEPFSMTAVPQSPGRPSRARRDMLAVAVGYPRIPGLPAPARMDETASLNLPACIRRTRGYVHSRCSSGSLVEMAGS